MNMALPDLNKFAADNGLDLIGVADMARLRVENEKSMAAVPEDLTRGIVVGVHLADAVLDTLENAPTPLYFHHYRQANYSLDRAAFDLAAVLQRAGHRALPVPASQITERGGRAGMVSHRSIGHAAGLGWIGRSSLLVNPKFGARVRYSTVLTNAPYEAGSPIQNNCGNCRACIGVCPAGAVKDSPDDFDGDACFKKLCEFRSLPFIGQHVCGVCVKACRGSDCV